MSQWVFPGWGNFSRISLCGGILEKELRFLNKNSVDLESNPSTRLYKGYQSIH
jgi:hypothetical protein